MSEANRYQRLIEAIFRAKFRPGAKRVIFEREEIVRKARRLGILLPKNLGDLVYSFRYRVPLPQTVRRKAPSGKHWVIRPAGKARYAFELAGADRIEPNRMITETKIPDATPGVIEKYALSDEQALLARIRYNRLVDVFTGVACYSLQNHLRTSVPGMGQVETDEIYVGLDRRGVHFVFPVQAKGARDALGISRSSRTPPSVPTSFLPSFVDRSAHSSSMRIGS